MLYARKAQKVLKRWDHSSSHYEAVETKHYEQSQINVERITYPEPVSSLLTMHSNTQ